MEKLLKILGFTWGVGSFIAAVAFFTGGEWREWEKVKSFVKEAPPASEISRRQAASAGPDASHALTCQILTQATPTPMMRNAEVSAVIPMDLVRQGYQRVGGGCKIPQAVIGGLPPHNGMPIESIPVENGWHCRVGDPPNIELISAVEAYVVACKVL
jgi:hypothetical protein